MFFSRITLLPDASLSRQFWSAFRSPYSLHRAIWELFGDRADRKRDFLYHVKAATSPPVVYAISARPPAMTSELWQAETKDFAPHLRAGMRLGFHLRANPVRTRDGKRHDVVMEEKHRLKAQGVVRAEWPPEADLVQTAGARWLGERSEKTGFRLHGVRADGYQQLDFSKKAGGRRVRLSTVDFTGVLEVIDPKSFRDALGRGFGPAKGFGCGMMMIRRA